MPNQEEAASGQRDAQTDSSDSKQIVDSTAVAVYRLGVRLGQAKLLHRIAESQSYLRVPAHDVWCSFQRLSSALITLQPHVILGECADWIKRIRGELRSHLYLLKNLDGEVQGNDGIINAVGNGLDEIESACRESLTADQSNVGRAWLDLGIEIVQVVDCRPTEWGVKSKPYKSRNQFPLSSSADQSFYGLFEWANPTRLRALLDQLGVTLDELFPGSDDDACEDDERDDGGEGEPAHDIPGLPEGLECWNVVEIGVRRLLEAARSAPSIDASDEKPPSQRKAYLREHAWLRWYEDEESKTHHSPAGIRDKWDQMSDEEREQICPLWPKKTSGGAKGYQAVKKAVERARKERANISSTPGMKDG